jgi:gluconokinase
VTTPPPAEVIIGLDVGTTAVKAVAFGLGAPWRAAAEHEYPLLRPAPGRRVQDPATVTAAVFAVLADCARAAAGARVAAVSVSTAMHGLLALDSAKQPLTPLITWADGRARAQTRALRTAGAAAELHRVSGAPVHPMTPLAKLLWFQQEEPGLAARARWWVGLKDYLLWQLTGTLATELSSASGTGLLAMATHDWNPDAIRLTGLSPEQLPEILPTTALLRMSADAADRTGLPAGTPVVAGAGDGPLGNLGAGAVAPGVAGLSLGTSGAVRTVGPHPYADPHGRLFCYALTDTAWVTGGAISNGGAVVRWAGRVLGQDLADGREGPARDAALLRLAEGVPPGSDGLVMLPYLLPERAPLWDPDLRGAYLGLRQSHGRAHLVRAAVEGVALQLSAIVADLDRVHPVTQVRATGGVFRSALWRAVLPAVLDRPVHLASGAEGSALGAAALGLYALGRAPRPEDALALLPAPGPAAPDEPLPAAPGDVAAYRALRGHLAELLGGLAGTAELFAH